jgi:hypothetical protein
MRIKTQLQIIALLIPMFFVPCMVVTVDGGTNLEWAIQPGDTFNYTITGFSENPTNNFTYRSYAIVNSLPVLSDNATEFYNMQLSRGVHYDFYFENGTEDYSDSYWLAFPVGNYSALAKLFENASGGSAEFFEASTVFGFVSYTWDSSIRIIHTFVFSKSSGALVHYHLETYEVYLGQTFLLDQVLDRYTPIQIWEMEMPKNEDGLYWGLETGDKINYTYTKSMPDIPTIELNLTVEIIFLPRIPDEITFPYQILLNGGSLYMVLENGTEIEQSYTYPMTAIAIGNWSVPHELDMLTWFMLSGEPEWIDNAQFWGFTVEENYGGVRASTRYIFSKVDGALEQYLVEYYDGFIMVGYIEMIRSGSPLQTTEPSTTISTSSTHPSTTTTPVETTTTAISTSSSTTPAILPFELLVFLIAVPVLLILIIIVVKVRGHR